jgi:carboxylesterase type B
MFVKINQGVLEGREDTSMSTGKTFYSFLGIPYAKPPVGELRFQVSTVNFDDLDERIFVSS